MTRLNNAIEDTNHVPTSNPLQLQASLHMLHVALVVARVRARERVQASNEKVCRQIRARTNDICCATHFRVTTLYVCVSLCVCVLEYV